MSGRYFDYRQHGIHDAAYAVDAYARRTDTGLSPETLARIRLAAATLRRAAHMLHCVDYLASGDYGEESFAEAWDEVLGPQEGER